MVGIMPIHVLSGHLFQLAGNVFNVRTLDVPVVEEFMIKPVVH